MRLSSSLAAFASLGLCAALAPAAAQMIPNPIFAGGYEAADVAATDAEAARFLTQASFGPTRTDINHVRAVGYGAWIDEQIGTAATLARPYLENLSLQNATITQSTRMDRWFNTAAVGPDQLRQRMAFALSQILVVSDRSGALNEDTLGTAEYWDILARDAFGSYRTLLGDVTFSPQMGKFLSHLRNQKSNGTLSPDENYAREVMQLFSIGLVFRNPDFSEVLDGSDQPVPSYDQSVVSAMAQVFTGLSYNCGSLSASACNPYSGLFSGPSGYTPMACFPRYHETAAKTIFALTANGPRVTLAAGPSCPNTSSTDSGTLAACQAYCLADINGTLDLLGGHAGVTPFDGHPNVPPFISRQLIERFVGSNPSPAYIQRVATVFSSSGGNLAQTLKALLLDPEARTLSTDPAAGKTREPMLRLIAMWRAWNAQMPATLPIVTGTSNSGQVPMGITSPESVFLQRALGAPSVFNFYEPDYQQPGPIADSGLYSPELEIVNESSIATGANSLYTYSWNSYIGVSCSGSCLLRPLLDLSGLTTQPGNAAMVDEANLRMLYGQMTLSMRTSLVNLLTTGMASANATDKARALVDVIALSPEYATQR